MSSNASIDQAPTPALGAAHQHQAGQLAAALAGGNASAEALRVVQGLADAGLLDLGQFSPSGDMGAAAATACQISQLQSKEPLTPETKTALLSELAAGEPSMPAAQQALAELLKPENTDGVKIAAVKAYAALHPKPERAFVELTAGLAQAAEPVQKEILSTLVTLGAPAAEAVRSASGGLFYAGGLESALSRAVQGGNLDMTSRVMAAIMASGVFLNSDAGALALASIIVDQNGTYAKQTELKANAEFVLIDHTSQSAQWSAKAQLHDLLTSQEGPIRRAFLLHGRLDAATMD
jgi:hypothetical protein